MPEIKIIHYRNSNKYGFDTAKGGKTIAYNIFRFLNSTVVLYGIAECSNKDNYVKKIGVQIAKERYETFPRKLDFPINNLNNSQIEYLVRMILKLG